MTRPAAGLSTAAGDPWHGRGLATAMQKAIDEQNRMSPEQRAEYERAAQRLRTAGDDDLAEGSR